MNTTNCNPSPDSTSTYVQSADAVLIESLRHDLTLHFMRDSSRLAEFQATVSAACEYDELNDTNEQQIVILTRWHRLLIPAYIRCSNTGAYTDTATSRRERIDIAVRGGK